MTRGTIWAGTTVLVGLAFALTGVALADAPTTTQPAMQHPQPPSDVNFQPDLVYATVDGETLQLDLSSPQEMPTPLPLVVVIHGGGWAAGHRNDLDQMTFHLAHHGYIAATLEYRLAPKYHFPAQVQDVKAAVRFLRGNAEKFHIDPQRVGAVGFSAGAHLSMMLGVMEKSDGLDDVGDFPEQSSKVQAVVSFFGPTDLTTGFGDATAGILHNFMGGSLKEVPDAYKQASPVTYVLADSAPMLLFQGMSDPLVPWKQAVEMGEAMEKAGAAGRVELICGAGHGWGGADMSRTALEGISFFDQYLKPRPR